jgi:prophage antirepressor-like protein
MNELQIFQNEDFGEFEVYVDENGKEWFPATKCAKILEYTNPEKAVRDHCKGVNVSFTPSKGGRQRKKFIAEGDLYRLIVRSKLPSAVKFEAWIFEIILPSIRKSGGFLTTAAAEKMLNGDPDIAYKFANLFIKSHERCKALETENAENKTEIEELKPKAEYFDQIYSSDKLFPITMLAKEFGTTAVAFNQWLMKAGIIYKIGYYYAISAKYANCGYAGYKYYDTGCRTMSKQLQWTEKGFAFLREYRKNLNSQITINELEGNKNAN